MEILLVLGSSGLILVSMACALVLILIIASRRSGFRHDVPEGGESGTVATGQMRDTNITFFDDPSGFSGVDLFAYGKAGLTFQGHRLYPCAVHHDHAAEYLYAILRVEGDGLTPTYCHVVDMCNRKDQPCDPNKNKGGRGFLVDVHKTGWTAIGANDGVIAGQCQVVGRLFPQDMPDGVFLKGADTYVMCSCTGRCEESTHRWVLKKKCVR